MTRQLLFLIGAMALTGQATGSTEAPPSGASRQTSTQPNYGGALVDARPPLVIPRKDGLSGIAAFAADNKGLTPDQIKIAYGISGRDGADREQALKLIKRTPDSLNFEIDGGDTLLTFAALMGEAEVVAAVLAKGHLGDMPKIAVRQIDIALGKATFGMAVQSTGYRPPNSPSAEAYMQTVRLLFNAGANIQTKDVRQNTLLDEALGLGIRNAADKKAKLDLILLLLEHNADPNALQPNTLASLNDESVLSLLLAHGLRLEKSRSTALLVEAVRRQNHAMVKMALDMGADPDVRPAGGQEPLLITADEESAKLLLAAGANPNACWGGTPPACRPNGAPLIFKFRQAPELLRLMIAKGANPNAEDAQGNTVLGYALERGMVLCAVSLEPGRPEQCLDESPLWTAAAIVLLNAGADPNKRSQGHLPLMLVDDSQHEVITLLLDKGARMDDTTLQGVRLGPVSMALATKRPFLAGELLRHMHGKVGSSEKWALFAAAGGGNIALVDGLAQHGADLDAQAPFGETALHYAAAKGDVAMVKRLLALGANPNLQTEKVNRFPSESINPLVIAAALVMTEPSRRKERQYQVVGVEPLRFRDGNMSPLMIAVESNNMVVTEALLNGGAKTTLKTQGGETALDIARYAGNSQMEQLLAGHK